MDKVNIAQKLTSFEEHWRPRIVGEVNDAHVTLVQFKGEFIWHHHDDEDEMFLVVRGRLLPRLRDHDILPEPGDFAIIPCPVEHLPVAEEEVEVLLIEPTSTLNTGNVKNDRNRCSARAHLIGRFGRPRRLPQRRSSSK